MTVLLVILGLVFLIAIHELGHMLTAKALGVRVDEFGIGFGPALFKRKLGKTVYSFRVILLGGFAKMAGMPGDEESEGPGLYSSKPVWKRAMIIGAGPAVNIAAAALIFSGLAMYTGVATEVRTTVQGIAPGSTAEEMGLEPGDRLVAVDGEPVGSWDAFTDEIGERQPGEPVALAVERGGERLELTGELGAAPNDEDQPQVGVVPEVGERSHNPLLALSEGVQRTVQLIGLQIWGIFQIITGQMNFFEQAAGPVGIVSIGSESVSEGFFLPMLAIISLILGVMNLLPILPLDGGHLLMLAIEKVRGRAVSVETMGKIGFIGIALMLTLMLFVTYADVSRIVSGESFLPR